MRSNLDPQFPENVVAFRCLRQSRKRIQQKQFDARDQPKPVAGLPASAPAVGGRLILHQHPKGLISSKMPC